jgi:hypothetical protein
MQAPQTVAALAEAVGTAVWEDTVAEGTAAALGSLFPSAVALRHDCGDAGGWVLQPALHPLF